MANIKSAKKRIRQTVKRTERNKDRVSRIRTFIKKLELAISGGKKAEATEAFNSMQSEVQRGVSKGVLKKNTAARKISRLSARVKALS